MMKNLLATAIATTLLAAMPGCAPKPEFARCRNDAMCEERTDDMGICENGRCVECVTDFTCGKSAQCMDGRCEP